MGGQETEEGRLAKKKTRLECTTAVRSLLRKREKQKSAIYGESNENNVTTRPMGKGGSLGLCTIHNHGGRNWRRNREGG